MAPSGSASVVMRAWMRRGPAMCLLWPVSLLFGMLLRLRIFLYRRGWLSQQKLPVPVIVIGNIFVGGTGKTPLTIWLLSQLRQKGYRPGVISRGYGSKHQSPSVVTPESAAQLVGDEPILIAQQSGCPVVVGRNRVEAGLSLLAKFPEVDIVISDDGLQHYALQRDIEIILFDSRGAGNGWLFPAGPLREPVSRRRDFTVANVGRGDEVNAGLPADTFRMQLSGDSAQQLVHPDRWLALTSPDPKLNIVASAGIGNPERFFAMLRGYGLCFTSLPLPDHYDFAINPFAHLTADIILITEKDAVKCRQSADIASDARIWVVPVAADVDPALVEAILKKLKLQ
jgi:tetraacyldisaccharide 4'-kinase